MPSNPMKTKLLKGKDGIDIFYRSWQPANAKHAIVMVHGAAAHSGLHYALLARRLYQAGYIVFAPDLRGHGRSGGLRGHVDSFEDYLDDLQLVMKKVRELCPEKVVLWGESLGGLICLDYATRHPKQIDGLITCAPGLHLNLWVPFPTRFYLHSLSCWLPTMYLPEHNFAELAINNPRLLARANRDPLLVKHFTVNYVTEVIEAGYAVSKKMSKITKPCLFQLAGEDQIVDTPTIAELFSTLGSKQKTLKIYEGLNHCLFAESPQLILDDTLEWLHDIIHTPGIQHVQKG